MRPHQLGKLFAPESIAVFGASDREGSVGARVFANLRQSGYAGALYPINPKHDTVHGEACYKNIADIESPIDLAIIAAPARFAEEIVRDCGEAGVKIAVVLSAGFRETGNKGAHLERVLLDTAHHYDIRIVGPNCLGVMRPHIGMNATFLNMDAPKGRLALVSQSGALCSAILDRAQPNDLGFSTVVTLGNAADVDFGDVLDFLATDYDTNAILLYVEGIHDARAFMSGLRTAARAKPVIVLKAGRYSRGTKAASTHTGALIGSDDVFDAALERAGAVRALSLGQLFAAAEILSSNRRGYGKRLAIVTNGGGPGVMAVDRAEDLGIDIATLSDATIATLNNSLSSNWSHANPVDILGDAPPEDFREAVAACLADRQVDGVLALFTPQAMSKPTEAAQEVVAAAQKAGKKPVLACWMGEHQVRDGLAAFAAANIPHFLTPERAVEAFSYLYRHRLNQRMLLQAPGPLAEEKEPDSVGARMIIDAALAEGRTVLSDVESKAILSAFGIPCTATHEAKTSTEALIAAESIGFPVVMKINSPQISHKSNVGGVKTNIQTAPMVRSTFEGLIEHTKSVMPSAHIKGVTIEAMLVSDNARELMVGVKNDPVFGPVIGFGAGGTMAEILRDSAVALPPLNEVLANRLISRTRVAKLLEAYRNMPAVDEDSVRQILLRVSEMVCELPHIQELDINPLFVDDKTAMAVDVRIVVKRPPVSPIPYSHMAIHPYPTNAVWHDHLSDGTPVIIRPIRPEDAETEQEFVRSLSPESRYFRFMYSVDELTPEMLARFTQIDYSREMALVAMAKTNGRARQIAVARYTADSEGDSCEFAISVLDEFHHHGLGSMLMKALMETARNRGLRMIEGEVLADNSRMLSLMRNLGFSVHTSPEDASIKVVERRL